MEDGDLTVQVSSVSNANATVSVVPTSAVFSLSSFTSDGDKSDFSTDKFDPSAIANFITDAGVIVDTSKGLVLSVSDAVSQVALANISNAAVADLQNHVSAQLLATHGSIADDAGDHVHTQLFAVHEDQVPPPQLHIDTTEGDELPGSLPSSASVDAEPKKRRGGWPKGKKRKKDTRDSMTPKAPATAYVLFAIPRRQDIKKLHPDLAFAEVTKILGNEWSTMAAEEKQKYIEEAEEDKKRYIEELKAYQQSEAYQNFIKKKKLKGICDMEAANLDPQYLESSYVSELEEEGLYCKVCNLYFSSLHNRREHLFGKQHLQNVTSEFEKELNGDSEALVNSELAQDILTSGSDHSPIGDSYYSRCGLGGPVDIEGFIQQFLEKNYERESETRELQKSLIVAKDRHSMLLETIQEYKALETKLEQDVGSLKAYGAALAVQIDGLKMVPTLFGVINF